MNLFKKKRTLNLTDATRYLKSLYPDDYCAVRVDAHQFKDDEEPRAPSWSVYVSSLGWSYEKPSLKEAIQNLRDRHKKKEVKPQDVSVTQN